MVKGIFHCLIVLLLLANAASGVTQEINSEKEYLNYIGQFMKEGNISKAIDYNEKMIAAYPESTKAYSSMALIYSEQNKLDEAVAYCNKAIAVKNSSLSPSDKESLYQAHSLLANIYVKQMQIGQAVAELKRAVELKPNADGAYYTMGILYAQTGEYDAARGALNHVVQIGADGESQGVLTNYAQQALEKIKDR